jgi:putative ABC transport system permease protein
MTSILELARQRQGSNPITKVFGSIGFIATALAATGMFALLAFSVVQRMHEIGIRIAIGATRRHLILTLLKPHAKSLGSGLVKGVFAGAMLLLFIRVFAFPVAYVELLGGFGLGIAFFSAVAVVAIVFPALRALRIDPSRALRTE